MLIVRPLDVLHLRGNRLFADASHGEAVMPPWPSVFSGALRSWILAARGVDFGAFGRGSFDDAAVAAVVGRSPTDPGSFRVTSVALADDAAGPGAGRVYFPLPADLFAAGDDESGYRITPLRPASAASLGGIGSFPPPLVPVLRSAKPEKPAAGLWIDASGMLAHLRGRRVPTSSVVPSSKLWKIDSRLGIALEPRSRTASQGMLYTTDAIALAQDKAFLVGVSGAGELLDRGGVVRLGGDGRGAQVVPWKPAAGERVMPWEVLPSSGSFRMILATPGVFRGGWLPPGVDAEGEDHVLDFHGLRARLVAAAVGRAGVVSGWNLAERRPKPAEKVVPAGSVYWFERIEGEVSALAALRDEGLWPLYGDLTPAERARRAEGFNNAWFGEWGADPGAK